MQQTGATGSGAEGERGSGAVCLNGAAARLVAPGDQVIIISHADYDPAELAGYEPAVVHVDRANHQVAAAQAGPAPHRYVEVVPS